VDGPGSTRCRPYLMRWYPYRGAFWDPPCWRVLVCADEVLVGEPARPIAADRDLASSGLERSPGRSGGSGSAMLTSVTFPHQRAGTQITAGERPRKQSPRYPGSYRPSTAGIRRILSCASAHWTRVTPTQPQCRDYNFRFLTRRRGRMNSVSASKDRDTTELR
jgi:hypothetical protein